MRIEKASQSKFRNWDRTVDIPTLEQFLGAGKQKSYKLLRLFNENTFQMLTEQLHGVYGVGKANEQGVDGMRYEWDIQGMPDQTTTVTINTAVDYNLGRNQQEFTICLAEPIANTNDLIMLENEQKLFCLGNGITLADGKYQYRVKLVTNNPDEAVDFTYLQIGRVVSIIGNLQPEMSRIGYIQTRQNKEKRVNYLFKIRKGIEYTGDAAQEKFYVCEGEDSSAKPSIIITGAEKEVLRQLMFEREKMLLWATSTVNPNNNQVLLTNSMGETHISGDGLVEQLNKDGMTMYYNKLTENTLRNVIMHIISKNPYKQTTDINITIMTGLQGMAQFDSAMRGILQGATNLDYLYDKEGVKVTVGSMFQEYKYLGATLRVVRNPIFDDKTQIADGVDNQGYPLRSSMMLIMDMSVYDGTPNIQVLSKKGAGVIKGNVKGIGGMSGVESGDFASPVHATRHDAITYGGIVIHYPETCVVLKRSLI